MSEKSTENQPTIFGHPSGLFTLFFAEMWERFSYYGMRALLLFYITKGFLGYNDDKAYGVYAAYTSLVYMTPYFGGMLARIMGERQAIVLGGLLMAVGHLLMMVEQADIFFLALAFLIAGNGFFKPNISTLVGEMYPKNSLKKDSGFTIFYMGINLGAAMSPILCGYIGETYGWHYGFGLATAGMLVGLAVFVMPTIVTQYLIGGFALITAIAMPFFQDSMIQLVVRIFLGAMLLVAAAIAVAALSKGPLSKTMGASKKPELLKKKILGPLSTQSVIFIGTAIAIVLFSLIVRQSELAKWILNTAGLGFLAYFIFVLTKVTLVERHRLIVVLVLFFFTILFWAFFEQSGTSLNNWADRNIDRVSADRYVTKADVGKSQEFRIAKKIDSNSDNYKKLKDLPVLSQEQLGMENANKEQVAIAKMVAIAQAAIKLKLDSPTIPKDKVNDEDTVKKYEKLAKFTKDLRAEKLFKMTELSSLREAAGKVEKPKEDGSKGALIKGDGIGPEIADVKLGEKKEEKKGKSYTEKLAAFGVTHDQLESLTWTFNETNVGMGIASSEIPASEFQAANPIYIIIFGLIFSGLWAFLASRKRDPSAAVKFSLGILQLGFAFGVFYLGAEAADDRGMSGLHYLLLGYLLLTTGELCLSPVGLSMVTKLSPSHLVSTIMGGYFLATAFSNFLAGFIAKLTSVGHGDSIQMIPAPAETVSTYGDLFGTLSLLAMGAAVVLFIMSPWLTKWMHQEIE